MSDKKLSREQVLHIAKLCKITLSEEEIITLSTMLGDAVEYIKILEELDTENVPETYQVTGLTNVFQSEDGKSQTLSQEDALKNAHEVIKNMFSTKAVFNR